MKPNHNQESRNFSSKIIVVIISTILLCICGCVCNSPKVVRGKFLAVTDSKPNTDSIYAERLKEGHAINPRYIELCYTIHNYTDEKMYLPIQTWNDSITKSSINVYFIEETDTIYPILDVKKNPYDTNYISKGDSLLLYIKVINFEEWSKNGIDVNTNIDTLINRLHVEYRKSPADEKDDYEIPNIEFGKSPQFYYEIPRDESVLKKDKEHYDRHLVRTESEGQVIDSQE